MSFDQIVSKESIILTKILPTRCISVVLKAAVLGNNVATMTAIAVYKRNKN